MAVEPEPARPREPGRDCAFCPRLAAFRAAQRRAFPGWHNAPVPSFGSLEAELLIVGLAPGLKGANRTGRPFTGDYAGELLYPTLLRFGFARGSYAADPKDGLVLEGCRITNAVRCVPPENRPMPLEASSCRPFLVDEIGTMVRLRAILALGTIAHNAALASLNRRPAHFAFRHGAHHRLEDAVPGRAIALFDSYHCSRYNLNTGRLTPAMFETVMAAICGYIQEDR